MVRLAWLLLVAVLASWAPRQARAFECSRVPPAGPSLYWEDRLVTYAINERGCVDIPGDAEFSAIRTSFTTWSDVAGSDLGFAEQPVTRAAVAGYNWRDPADNENLMIFRHGTADEPLDAWRHELGSIAVTTTTFNSRTGELYDADIEFNAARYEFSACTPPGGGCEVAYDVQNTATHEIGHLFGLDHPPTDQPGVDETTMFASAPRGEVKKRDLDVDDVQGIVFLYPAGAPSQQCYPAAPAEGPYPSFSQVGSNPDNGCLCGAGSDGGAASTALLGLAALLRAIGVARRSRRRANM